MAYSSIRGSNFHANRLGTIRAGSKCHANWKTESCKKRGRQLSQLLGRRLGMKRAGLSIRYSKIL